MNSENYKLVKEKLQKELDEIKKSSQGAKEAVVVEHVANNLILFAKNEEFCLAIKNSEATLKDCCKEIMKGVGNHISDIDVYRKAAQFYFKDAEIEFNMSIIIKDEKTKVNNQTNKSKKIDISLDDLF